MSTANEQKTETEIQAKGKTAPRLTPGAIDYAIMSTAFHVFPGTTLTVCALTLRNGYQVVGESACASADNFDAALGQRLAFEDARRKVWSLEGYLLRSKLAGQVS